MPKYRIHEVPEEKQDKGMKIYILWNKEENRPAIRENMYGALVAFPSKIQLQVFIFKDNNPLKDEFSIRGFTIE